MAGTLNTRGPDRRSRPRGGRRAEDRQGLTPLVMVVDPEPDRRDLSHAILVRLSFAVAPVSSLAEATAAIPTLAPEVIVASADAAPHVVAALAGGTRVPIVTVDGAGMTDAVVESIRRAIRQAAA